MLKINIQLFAHKKGQGSSHNGRESESKRLGIFNGKSFRGFPFLFLLFFDYNFQVSAK